MDINERVKAIRKAKELSQEEFGRAIGLSASGISNIEYKFRKVTDKHIKLLCATFNVSEEWLRTGEGEMFVQTNESVIESLAKKYALDEMDCSIIESYMQLPPSARAVMKNYLNTLVTEFVQRDETAANALLRSRAEANIAADTASSADTGNDKDAHA